MSKRDDPHGPVLPDACNAMYDGFRDKLRSIPARPPVGDTTQPQPTDARYRVADAIRREVRTQLGLKTGDYFSVHWESVADAALAALNGRKAL